MAAGETGRVVGAVDSEGDAVEVAARVEAEFGVTVLVTRSDPEPRICSSTHFQSKSNQHDSESDSEPFTFGQLHRAKHVVCKGHTAVSVTP